MALRCALCELIRVFSCGFVRAAAVQALHGQQLVGRFVLQLDEAVNTGAAARERCAALACALRCAAARSVC